MYKLGPTYGGAVSCIIRIVDNVSIPLDPANTDYQQYLKWLEEGNQPLPAEETNQE